MKSLLYFLLLFCSIGCTTTKYVEVPVDRVKVEYKETIKYDSIYNNDSIYIKEKGDTVTIYKYKYLYKYQTLRDTICKTDTITKINIVEKVKEINVLNKWQRSAIVLGMISSLITIFLILFKRR